MEQQPYQPGPGAQRFQHFLEHLHSLAAGHNTKIAKKALALWKAIEKDGERIDDACLGVYVEWTTSGAFRVANSNLREREDEAVRKRMRTLMSTARRRRQGDR